MTVINCGTLIDGLHDESFSEVSITVSGDTFGEVDVSESVDSQSGSDVIDHANKTVIPGLIDAHVHIRGIQSTDPFDRMTNNEPECALRANDNLQKPIAAGFTSLRDASSRISLDLRNVIRERSLPKPRIYASGQAISQTAGHADNHFVRPSLSAAMAWGGVTADGVDECVKQTRTHLRNDVDFIKIMTSGGIASQHDHPDQAHFTEREVDAITSEAHRWNRPVASHAHSTQGVKLALQNGVDTIEHGVGIDSEALDLFKKRDAVYVPTLTAINEVANTDPSTADIPEWMVSKAKEVTKDHFDTVERAYNDGVPIAHGTDLGDYSEEVGLGTIREFELFVDRVGMSRMDAIKSGTSVAASALADDSIGAIQSGRKADFVVLNSDPLDDIRNLNDVHSVYKDGVKVFDTSS